MHIIGPSVSQLVSQFVGTIARIDKVLSMNANVHHASYEV